MILGTLDRLVDIFRSPDQIAYRKTLGKTLKGKIVVEDILYEFDSMQKNIRKEYYKIFESMVDNSKLRYNVFPSGISDPHSLKVAFYGDDLNVGIKLEYTQSQSLINLNFKPRNVESHGVKGNGYNNYINVITIYTHPELNEETKDIKLSNVKLKTRILPGNYVTGESLKSKVTNPYVDQKMSELYHKILTSKIIPRPVSSDVFNFPDYESNLLAKRKIYVDKNDD